MWSSVEAVSNHGLFVSGRYRRSDAVYVYIGWAGVSWALLYIPNAKSTLLMLI